MQLLLLVLPLLLLCRQWQGAPILGALRTIFLFIRHRALCPALLLLLLLVEEGGKE